MLKSKKHRQHQQRYVAEGEKIVREIIEQQPQKIEFVVGTDPFFSSLSDVQRSQLGAKLLRCDQKTLDTISSLSTPSPVLAIMQLPEACGDVCVDSGLSLYLDAIRDPGNMGTILRIADWFGINAVYLSEDCVDVFNPKSIQASMGAFLRVRTRFLSLADIVRARPSLAVIGTKISGGDDALQFDWPSNSLLVIGSESHGIQDFNVDHVSQWISIPSGEQQSCSESLNAAIATGILCAAHLRQHRMTS